MSKSCPTDVKSAGLLWPGRNPHPHYPKLKADLACDVVIIGAGVVGALAAYYISKHSRNVVLLDRDPIAQGSTSASTACLMYQLDVPLSELSKKVGPRRARAAYAASYAAVSKLKRLIKSLGSTYASECGYRPKKVLYLADNETAGDLRREQRALEAQGYSARLFSRAELLNKFGLDRAAGMQLGNAAEIDPVAFTQTLIRRAHSQGVQVFTGAEVSDYELDCASKVLRMASGKTVTARHVVIATGYESCQFLTKKIVNLKSSYVIAGAPHASLAKHWLHDYLVWELNTPYLYIRTTSDHRIIVGGEDVNFSDAKRRDKRIPKKARTLAKKFEKLFAEDYVEAPPLNTRNAWAGTFGETPDGIGYAGAPRELPGVYFALGFGGNGITSGLIAAEIIADFLRGKSSPNQSLFSFDR